MTPSTNGPVPAPGCRFGDGGVEQQEARVVDGADRRQRRVDLRLVLVARVAAMVFGLVPGITGIRSVSGLAMLSPGAKVVDGTLTRVAWQAAAFITESVQAFVARRDANTRSR